MINISKEEAQLIRKYFPYVCVQRTVHKYCMEENKRAMDFLRNYSVNPKVVNRYERRYKSQRI